MNEFINSQFRSDECWRFCAAKKQRDGYFLAFYTERILIPTTMFLYYVVTTPQQVKTRNL